MGKTPQGVTKLRPQTEPLRATVICDTREQRGWTFAPSDWCAGTRVAGLPTGDYALEGCGLEGRILIERKRDTKEVAQNVLEPRFKDVLSRLSCSTDYAFVVCEFPYSRFHVFPNDSGIPRARQKGVRLSPHTLLMKVEELMLDYPRVRWQFCDSDAYARDFARGIFKRLVERRRSELKATL